MVKQVRLDNQVILEQSLVVEAAEVVEAWVVLDVATSIEATVDTITVNKQMAAKVAACIYMAAQQMEVMVLMHPYYGMEVLTILLLVTGLMAEQQQVMHTAQALAVV
jgi:hypothetical protein